MTPEALQRIEAALARTDEIASSFIRVVPPLEPETFPVCVDRLDLRALLEALRGQQKMIDKLCPARLDEAQHDRNAVDTELMKKDHCSFCGAALPAPPSSEAAK